MSRPFETYESLNRAWDVRFLESHSLRKAFVWLLVDVFMLGAMTFMLLYEGIRQHRFDLPSALQVILFSLTLIRISPVIYRRLPR